MEIQDNTIQNLLQNVQAMAAKKTMTTPLSGQGHNSSQAQINSNLTQMIKDSSTGNWVNLSA